MGTFYKIKLLDINKSKGALDVQNAQKHSSNTYFSVSYLLSCCMISIQGPSEIIEYI